MATRLALRRKFLTATKGEGETMLAYVGRVQAMAFELECINVGVTEEDRILALTMGLDASYESFVISLETLKWVGKWHGLTVWSRCIQVFYLAVCCMGLFASG